MDRIVKKLGEQQAMRGSASMTSFLTKMTAVTTDASLSERRSPITSEEDSGVVRMSSPGQAEEPKGTTEWSVDEEHDEKHSVGGNIARRRRLKPVADSDSDGDESVDDVKINAGDATQQTDANGMDSDGESLDLHGNKSDTESEDEHEGQEEDKGEQDDDQDEAESTKEKLRAEDFDDEEEFLLAGGEIEEAKKRKEWGLHQLEGEDEEKDPTALPEQDAKAQEKLSKEKLRQIQRESERLLRERRCMIPPAPVQRRSFGDLVKKISSRSQVLDKTKIKLVEADKNVRDSTTAETANTNASRVGALQSDVQTPAPALPCEDHSQENLKPIGVAEEEDEDELVIIAPKPSNRNKPSFEVKQNNATAPQPASHAQAIRSLAFSPPSNNSKRLRNELRNSWMKTAQLRSEHLMKAQQALAFGGNADSASADSNAPRFIPSESFTGSKQGYVYKYGNEGLGYYKDTSLVGVNTANSLIENILPPPIQDVAEDSEMPAEKNPQDMVEGDESQPRVVLEYEDDDNENDVGLDAQPTNEPAILTTSATEAAQAKPRRTYARKDRDVARSVSGPGVDVVEKFKAQDERADSMREPVTSDEDEEEAEAEESAEGSDDEGSADDEDDGDDEDDESSEEDDEEEAKPAQTAPQKKTLADITSIKRQTTLRLGTMEAGYLRTEQEALGIHEDIGIADEDLGEGIDLEDTDGENASEEEEDSEEERRVAEGFLEDAKFAGEINTEVLREAHMEMMEKDEKRITDKILDVIRGDVRRRKAVQETDDWIPNRNARMTRLQNGGETEYDGADQTKMDQEMDAAEAQEEEAARVAAALAKERLERMKFAQQKRELDAQEHSSDEENDAGVQSSKPAPLVRKVSCAVPSLAEFGRSFSNGGLVRSISKDLSAGGAPGRALAMKRGSSLLGLALQQQPAEGQGQAGAQLPSSKVFFFDTKQRSDSGSDGTFNASEAVSTAMPQQTAMARKRSGSNWNPVAPKAAKTGTDMKRSTSILLQNLNML